MYHPNVTKYNQVEHVPLSTRYNALTCRLMHKVQLRGFLYLAQPLRVEGAFLTNAPPNFRLRKN